MKSDIKLESRSQSMFNFMRELGRMPGLGQENAESIAILRLPHIEVMQLAAQYET